MTISEVPLSGVSKDLTFTTRNTSVAKKASAWRTQVNEVFFHMDTKVHDRSEFEGDIRLRHREDRAAALIEAGPQMVVRTRQQAQSSVEHRTIAVFQIAGTSKFEQSGRQALLNEGDFCFINNNCPYTMDFRAKFSQICLDFPSELLINGFQWAEDFTAVNLNENGPFSKPVFELSKSLISTNQHPNNNWTIYYSKLIELLALAATDVYKMTGRGSLSFSKEHLFRASESQILTSLRSSDLSVASLAAKLGISERYLREIYNGTNLTPHSSIVEKRLTHAKNELICEHPKGKTISEVAYRWGFSNSSHFSRCFQKRYGVSPSNYRRAIATNDSIVH